MTSIFLRAIVTTIALLSSITGLSGRARAADGYKIFPKEERVAKVTLNLKDKDFTCSEVDMWGQSDLVIYFTAPEASAPLPIFGVSRLYDGACEGDYAVLVARARQGAVEAGLYLKVEEVITWGIISEGSDREESYCTHELTQFVYLTNDPLFPPYEYQSSNSVKIADLDYDFCVAQYGQ